MYARIEVAHPGVDRKDTLNGIGGGLIVYVKDGIIIKPISVESELNMFVRFKIVSMESKDDRDLTVTLVYRPPLADQTNINELCKLFENCDENSIFIGDINFPAINWSDLTSDRSSEAFLNCITENGFDQLVDFPTHLRGNTLDLVITNQPENILCIEPIGNLTNSDHSILSIDLVFSTKFNIFSELIYDWRNRDNAGLKTFLGEVDWDQEMGDLPTEEAWQRFTGKINVALTQFIPKIKRRSNKNHQWMTKAVKKLVRRKQNHYNIYMQTRSPYDHERYKRTEKECKRAIRKAKKKFESTIAKNGNKRPFNSYIKSKTKAHVSVGPLKRGNDLITDNTEMAEILNSQLS